MHIVFFTHPAFQAHQSMPRYARWLAEGMQRRGHTIALWTAKPFFYKLPAPSFFKKWLGYADQFLLFPRQVQMRLKKENKDTLFVFTDHALGPWVPLVANRKHVIHCHDFLAQQSALGHILQNPTSWSGKQYQSFIRSGYSKGQNFIAISYKTQADLLSLLPTPPRLSTVIYNGVNPLFTPLDKHKALQNLQRKTGLSLQHGFILHVGGNQWYKNRAGVIQIYTTWRKAYKHLLPLVMIGERPDERLLQLQANSAYKEAIHFLSDLGDGAIVEAYNTATLFLFPSLAEGFGWPIAEAMACGCPVVTTGDAPMNEVGGNAASYVPKMPGEPPLLAKWLQVAAANVEGVVQSEVAERKAVQIKGWKNVKRFESEQQLTAIESVYLHL